MKCPNCSKTASVTIGGKQFCTNCGALMSGESSPSVSHDFDHSPKPAARSMRDVTPGSAQARPVVPVRSEPKPATELHARLNLAKGGVLDLRDAKPKPIAKPKPEVKHVAVPAPDMHSPAKTQAELPTATGPNARHRQLQHQMEVAGQIERSPLISRFSDHASQPTGPTLAAQPTEAATPMPNQAVAHHEHLSRLLELSSTAEANQDKYRARPTRTSFAAAAIAIAIIGGYIWVHNYPHLAISTAADKAGFSASLPNFVPSSYSLNGPVSYGPGEVTLNYASPSFSTPLKVTQQPTTWDSESLLDNYVTQQSGGYSTVQGQGLTIYLFNNSQDATWVNHGIWYTVDGATNIGRDQLLKMAYSF